jgi:hypothetical protein
MGLFTQANYKFSSHAPPRPSTFYFSDAVGNRGRFRRQHAQGPELVFQGRCRRIFISPELEAKITVLADLSTGDDNAFNEVRYGKIAAIHPMLAKGDPDAIYRDRASLMLRDGWRLFDSNGILVHFSAGQILRPDPAAAQFFLDGGAAALANYNGAWAIW